MIPNYLFFEIANKTKSVLKIFKKAYVQNPNKNPQEHRQMVKNFLNKARAQAQAQPQRHPIQEPVSRFDRPILNINQLIRRRQ